MLDIVQTSKFRKDYELLLKQGKDMSLLEEVIDLLIEEKQLPRKYKDHPLSGNWKGCRECHIQGDWILIYKIDNNVLTLTLSRSGSHSRILHI